jgi:hypothetical protein
MFGAAAGVIEVENRFERAGQGHSKTQHSRFHGRTFLPFGFPQGQSARLGITRT